MPPLAGDVLRAGPQAAVDHQAAADAGAHDDAEDEARAPARPRCRASASAKQLASFSTRTGWPRRRARSAGRSRPLRHVGVASSSSGRCGSRWPRACRCRCWRRRDAAARSRSTSAADGLDDVVVAAGALGGHALATQHAAVGVVEHDALDLGSAEIDADAARHAGCVTSRRRRCNRPRPGSSTTEDAAARGPYGDGRSGWI